jgi:hypothetical protein
MTVAMRARRGKAPAAPVDLDDAEAVRSRLVRAVRNYEIRDTVLPVIGMLLGAIALFVAWGVFKHSWSAGDYFLLPCLISAVGLGVAGAFFGPSLFDHHPKMARAIVVEPDATVTRARITRVEPLRAGLPAPGGPPAVVRLEARFPNGELLRWRAQAPARPTGIGGGRSDQGLAVLGVPAPGRWLLALSGNGDVIWALEPAAASPRASQAA